MWSFNDEEDNFLFLVGIPQRRGNISPHFHQIPPPKSVTGEISTLPFFHCRKMNHPEARSHVGDYFFHLLSQRFWLVYQSVIKQGVNWSGTTWEGMPGCLNDTDGDTSWSLRPQRASQICSGCQIASDSSVCTFCNSEEVKNNGLVAQFPAKLVALLFFWRILLLWDWDCDLLPVVWTMSALNGS